MYMSNNNNKSPINSTTNINAICFSNRNDDTPSSPCSTPGTQVNLERMLFQFEHLCTLSTSPISASSATVTTPDSGSSAICNLANTSGPIFQPSLQCKYQMHIRKQMESLTPVDSNQAVMCFIVPDVCPTALNTPIMSAAATASVTVSSPSQTSSSPVLHKHDLHGGATSTCGMQAKDDMIHNILQVALQKRRKLKQKKMQSALLNNKQGKLKQKVPLQSLSIEANARHSATLSNGATVSIRKV